MAKAQKSDNQMKEEVDEIMTMKLANSLITEDIMSRNQPAVVGAVANSRGQTSRLYATTSWTGNFHMPPIGSVNAGERVQFSHKGSQGALIYGQQQGSSNPVGYLLAWSMGSGPRRVYVKSGPLSQVYYKGWESAALANLNSSSANSSATDDRTSSRVQARIQDESGTFPLGVILASFV